MGCSSVNQDLSSRFNKIPLIVCMCVIGAMIIGWLSYECFGHIVIKAAYEGRGPAIIADLIEFQHKRPVEHYQRIADGVFYRFLLVFSVSFAFVLMLVRLFFSKKRLRLFWAIAICMCLPVMVYVLNPYYRVYSIHGFYRGSIVYQILNGFIPPMDPLFAGETLQSPWGFPWLAAQISRVLNITPFSSFAVINVLSLGAVMLLAYKISQLLIKDERANICSAVIAVFATTPFSRSMIQLLLSLIHSSKNESRAIPAFIKFTNVNGAPLGMVFFLLFVFSVMKLFENKKTWLWAAVVLVSVVSCGFFYVPMVPAIIPCVLMISVLYLLLRKRQFSDITIKPFLLLWISSVIGFIILVPYYISARPGVSVQAELFGFYFAFRNMINFLVPMAALLAIIALNRKFLVRHLNHRSLIILMGVFLATMSSFLFIHITDDVEYKFLLLSVLVIGIVGGIAIHRLLDRFNRVLVLVLVGLLLFPSYVEVSGKLIRYGNNPILYFKETPAFWEKGQNVRAVNEEEQQMYSWILDNTPVDAVFIDSRMRIPIFGRRRLFIGVNMPDGSGATGYSITMEDVKLRHGYDQGEFERRKKIVDNFYGYDDTMTDAEVIDALGNMDVYIISRKQGPGKALKLEDFEQAFKSSESNFIVVKPHGNKL